MRPLTKLDREAQMRGNSVYFPDRVVPMLPERISNDLCSLVEGKDRGVLVARMIFDADGDKRSHTFLRAMMRSAAKLSYQEAQAAIDGTPSAKALPILETVLKPLWEAYAKLAAARDRREPLDLDLPERKIRLDKDGRVASIDTPERLAAHRLIEECMIQANVAAAESLEGKKGLVVYRVHDQPSREKLKNLRDFLDTLDLKIPPAGELKPGALNKILAEAKGLPVPELVNEIVLRSQSQAEYNPDNIGHFGLNLRKYAHFTSPIRRYADLLVHRALIKTLKLGEGGLHDEELPKLRAISQAISGTERRAMAAERETNDRLIAAHLANHIGATFNARIAGVTRLRPLRPPEGHRRRRLHPDLVARQRILQPHRGSPRPRRLPLRPRLPPGRRRRRQTAGVRPLGRCPALRHGHAAPGPQTPRRPRQTPPPRTHPPPPPPPTLRPEEVGHHP